jgi:Fe2+ or Zn2+ uptake regulation protein
MKAEIRKNEAMNREAILNMFTRVKMRSSNTRYHVFKYLMEKENHPTISTIYDDLLQTFPSLSKMSIYNSIKALEEKGLVKSLTLEGNELRYDARVDFHAHFKCESCEKVFDVFVKEEDLPDCDMDGFYIKKQDFFMSGLCPVCKKKTNVE